ncbi:MAG: carboxyl transferase domain-containing protein [Candidatus Bathyarchaeia archaeon]
MLKKIEELRKLIEQAKLGGGVEAIEAQHKKGKLTAHERLEKLLDSSTFIEMNQFVTHHCVEFDMDKKKAFGDGVVTGFGMVNDRPVAVFAQDFTFIGGSLGEMHAKKICEVMDLALKIGIPIIGLNDSGGARIQEGVSSLAGYGEIFFRNVLASGVVPQISIIMGPCAGGAVYSPALTDFIFMVKKTSYMFITGPKVVKAVTGEDVTPEQLGGGGAHSKSSGVAHFLAENEEECLLMVRKLLSYLPLNNLDDPPMAPSMEPDEPEKIVDLIPEDTKKPYNMLNVIDKIFDKDSFFEVHKYYAPNAIVGFARLNGFSVGVIANQPAVLTGVLDVDSSDKIARFIRFCDAFNIPLITLVDVPGYLPGVNQEYGGIIRHGAKVIYAYSEASVPKLTVITRKAYGGGYIAMCSKHLGADAVFAWPTAEIAVMGPEGAAEIIFSKEIAKAENPEEALLNFAQKYREKVTNPYVAASKGYVTSIIEPQDTRKMLISYLIALRRKRGKVNFSRKHGNIPL